MMPLPSPRMLLLIGVLSSTMASSLSMAEDQPLGRLFFTPEKRAALERQRRLNIQEAQTLEGATMSLNGVVLRSSGKKTVWINGRAQQDELSPLNVTAAVKAKEARGALLSANGEPPAELKVGEAINRATREKNNGLQGGSLQVNPAKR